MDSEIKKIYKQLSAPFPKEALKDDNSRGFILTSVKAQYIKERLNEVMGPNGWDFESEVVKITDEGVAVKLKLTLKFPDGTTSTKGGFGGGEFKSKAQAFGDPFKGAETDALSKAASAFGVANDVFKGLVEPPGKSKRRGKKTRRRRQTDDFEDL